MVGGLGVVVMVQWMMHEGCIGRRLTTQIGRTFANWNVLADGRGDPVFDLADLRPECVLHYGWGSDKHNIYTEFEQQRGQRGR